MHPVTNYIRFRRNNPYAGFCLANRFRRFQIIIILLSGIFIAPLHAESFKLHKDQLFTHKKIPFSFTILFDAAAFLEKKGNYESIRIRQNHQEGFLIYIQTIPVIRIKELKTESYCNTIIPAEESFDIINECSIRSQKNDLNRYVRLIKQKNLLYMIFITYRKDHPFPVSNIVWQPLSFP